MLDVEYRVLFGICEVRDFRPFLLDGRRCERLICPEYSALASFPPDLGNKAGAELEDLPRRVRWRVGMRDRQNERRNEFGLTQRLALEEKSEEEGRTLRFASMSGGMTVSVIALAAI